MMYSVFSKYLIESFRLVEQARTRTKVTREIDLDEALRRKPSIEPHMFLSLNPVNEIADEELSYIIATKQDVNKVVKWATQNILHKFKHDTYITRSVKIRIVADMLNKCNIEKMDGIFLHDNLVKNLNDLHKDKVVGELPF